MLATIQTVSSESSRDGDHELQQIIQDLKKKMSQEKRQVYLEELELERERWRLRPGDLERERRRAGDRLLGDRDLSRQNMDMLII